VKQERLHFTTDAAHAVQHGQVQLIAVGTPSDEDGSADLQYVLAVAESIARHMHDYKVIVNKSTVPVGTAGNAQTRMEQLLAARGVKILFQTLSSSKKAPP
jgi:UDPglucose 6-dehydrogenase